MTQVHNRPRLMSARFHIYMVVAMTFLALLFSAAQRSTPSVLMLPLQLNFGWDRATISFAAAVGIFLYGLTGPFAGALMVSIGIRRTMMLGMMLMAAGTFASLWMRQSWEYVLTWGVLSGLGTGAVAPVLGAAIVNRWFAKHQGLVIGLLSASTATGTLIFLPFLAWLSTGGAWRPVVLASSIGCLALVPLIWLFVPERPSDIGTGRFGEAADAQTAAPLVSSAAGALKLAFDALFRAARRPVFWLLFVTFFICGLTTNGLVGTHMIAFCGDHGIAPVAAAGLLSTMGFFDLFGTTLSGWFTDRVNSRTLLAVYYGLRGLSLIALPFINFDTISLGVFAVFYGLDWIATLPPTIRLTNEAFGENEGPIVLGWIVAAHQIGAAAAAFGAGLIREETGSYMIAFVGAGFAGVLAALIFLVSRGISAPSRPALAVS